MGPITPPAPPVRRGQPWSLSALAWLGTLGYQFVVLAPVALLIAIACLQFRAGWAWWLGGALLLGVWWMTQGGEAPEGTEVTREEAPRLWDTLDTLADRMRVPRLARVVLTPDVGAAAIEHQDAWRPWRFHRTLSLGVPLLACLGEDELKAVVAHELGHFSRHFGWGGHWLYRARLGWASLLAHRNDETVWYRAASAYAGWFVPFFERRSAVQAVANEYEADALAAQTTSADALGRALARLAALDEASGPRFGEGPLPGDPLGRATPGLGEAIAPAALAQALQRQANWHARQDPVEVTHPAVRDRLHALGLEATALGVPAVAPDAAAGPVWWQGGWPKRLAAENDRWRRQHGRAWRNAAAWRQACEAQLAARTGTLSLDTGIECQLALGQPTAPSQLPGAPDGRAPLEAFWVGSAWLAHDPTLALRWFEAAIASCVALAAPARRRVVELSPGQLGATGLARQQDLLAHAIRRRDEARTRVEALGLDAGQPVMADEWRRAALVEALAADPAVQRAAWVQHDITLSSGRSYSVVSLCLQILLDPDAIETGVAQDYAGLLASSITPLRVGWVRTWWTTEDWPAGLERLAQGAPAGVLKHT